MLWVRLPPGPQSINALADQRSGRHALIVEIEGSNPFQGTVCSRPVRLLVRLPVFHTGQRGSKPLRATDIFRGRLMGRRRSLTSSMLVRSQPPELDAPMVKRTSWLFPKEQVQVRFLVGVLGGANWKTFPVETDGGGFSRRRWGWAARRSAATRSQAGSTPAGVSATISGVAQTVLTHTSVAQRQRHLSYKEAIAGSIPAGGTELLGLLVKENDAALAKRKSGCNSSAVHFVRGPFIDEGRSCNGRAS